MNKNLEMVKELLLESYQKITFGDFLEITEDIYMEMNYDVRNLCTDVDDFRKYILS